MLLWLWYRLEAVAPIQPLAWEPPYGAGVALRQENGRWEDGYSPSVAGAGERKDAQRKLGCTLAPEGDPSELALDPSTEALPPPCMGPGAPQHPL